MASPLTRAGFPTSRNLDRPFKGPRYVGSKPYWTDFVMKQDRQVGNGVMGTKSTFSVRAKVHGPKSGRRVEKRPKRGCKLISNDDILAMPHMRIQWLKELRGKILTVRYIGDFLERDLLGARLSNSLTLITNHIFSHINQAEAAKLKAEDIHREKSTIGRMATGGLKMVKLKHLAREIEFAVNSITN